MIDPSTTPTRPPAAMGMGRRRFLVASVAGAAGAVALSACSSSSGVGALPEVLAGSPGTIPQSSAAAQLGQGAGTVALFAQEDLNFQALIGLGSVGVNSEAGELIASVDQANAAAGGAATRATTTP